MRLLSELRSHIYYKIVFPFLLLTLLVALIGSTLAFFFVAGNAQERMSNHLATTARTLADSIVKQEGANLVFLREMAFAGPNPASGAPAVAAAVAAGDTAGLEQAIQPYFQISARRNARVDRLIIFDAAGQSVLDWERRTTDDGSVRLSHPPRDLRALWFVPAILASTQDQRGDKFAGLLTLDADGPGYLYSVAPVVVDEQVVGGLIVASELDHLLRELQVQAQAAFVAVYNPDDGTAVLSTITPLGGLESLAIRPALLPAIQNEQHATVAGHLDTRQINERGFQLAYAPLRVRGVTVGIVSVALSTDYVTGPWADARLPLIAVTLAMMSAIVGLGTFIGRQITQPLRELVATAQAVTAGDLERRSTVQGRDELGVLASSFNTMTAHLFDLYRAVHAESSERAAIIDSISDGVIVCDPAGNVKVINQAARELLRLAADDQPPALFADIPLVRITEPSQTFGAAFSTDLFHLHEQIVHAAAAPVNGEDGERIGIVCVLQDFTEAIAADRAKTNFIATISHEMRTPLTVLIGNLDLLLRDLLGPLNDDQREILKITRGRVDTMTTLLNNAILIASLDSGRMEIDIRPTHADAVLLDAARSVRHEHAAKELELQIDFPEQLPRVLADEALLRQATVRLLDNAFRYTSQGHVTIRATATAGALRVDIVDTGRGISEELRGQLFGKFIRGMGAEEGINSGDRGIGLGLAIAQQLIERQGGRIWLAETSDQGSCFSLTLQLAEGYSHEEELVIMETA